MVHSLWANLFKMDFKQLNRKIFATLAPPFLYCLIRLLHFTYRHSYEIPQSLKEHNQKDTFIIAFWHGELLLQPFLFKHFCKNRTAYVLISHHFDGDIISNIMKFFGIESLRGSSSKGGIKVLLSGIKKLQEGEVVVVTPDGPRGPYHSIANGILMLSQKSNKPIVVFRTLAKNCWNLKSWDKFQIPKPFSKIQHIAMEPFYIKDLNEEEAKKLILSKMEELQ